MTSTAPNPHSGASDTRLDQVLRVVGGLVWSISPSTTRLLEISGDTLSLLGRTRAELHGVRVLELVHPEDRAQLRKARDTLASSEGGTLTCRILHVDGDVRWFHSTLTPVRDLRGRLVRIDGVSTDRTEQLRQLEALRVSEQRLKLVIKGANDGWWDWDIAAGVVHLGPRWFEVIGREVEDAPVAPEYLLEVVHPDDRAALDAAFTAALAGELTSIEVEVRLQHVDGRDVPVLLRGYVLRDPDPIRISGSNVDLTALRLAEARQAALYRDLQQANAELERQATIDALTGVANRRRFDAFLSQVWERAQVGNLPVGLLLCDVDHFKLYNDHHGHPAGDRCLIEVSDAISTAVRGVGDLVARYGGEEFAVVLPGTLPDDALAVAERIRTELTRRALPHPHSPVASRVTMSIGIACLRPRPDEWSQTLITRADDALLHAKRAGRDRIEVDMGTALGTTGQGEAD